MDTTMRYVSGTTINQACDALGYDRRAASQVAIVEAGFLKMGFSRANGLADARTAFSELILNPTRSVELFNRTLTADGLREGLGIAQQTRFVRVRRDE